MPIVSTCPVCLLALALRAGFDDYSSLPRFRGGILFSGYFAAEKHFYDDAVTRPLRTQSKRGAVPGGPARPRSEIPFPVQRFSRANSTATGNRRKSTRTNNDKAFLVLLFGSSWVARAGEPAQNQHSSSACLRKRSGHFCGFATHRQLKSFSN